MRTPDQLEHLAAGIDKIAFASGVLAAGLTVTELVTDVIPDHLAVPIISLAGLVGLDGAVVSYCVSRWADAVRDPDTGVVIGAPAGS